VKRSGSFVPGQTPAHDRAGLRIRGAVTQSDINALEAENIRRALVKYLSGRPTRRSAKFDVGWLLRLHREMFGAVWKWAGKIRTSELNLGSHSHQIETDLHNLVEDLNAWEQSGMPLLEQAVRLHHAAVRIHPFLNGSGRWSRVLSNIWLVLHDHPPIMWPETIIGTESTIRGEYLAAAQAADRGDLSLLMSMHERYVERP